jgi:hypothetical protein
MIWGTKVFPQLHSETNVPFQVGRPEDACMLMEACLRMLGKGNELAHQCYQITVKRFTQKGDSKTCNSTEKKDILNDLLMSNGVNDFMALLRTFRNEQLSDRDGAIHFRQIENPPKVLFAKIPRLSVAARPRVVARPRAAVGEERGIVKDDRPIVFPLSFKFPKEIMVTPREVEYRFVGGVVHLGNAHGGHYIAYIRDPDGGFWEFNDFAVRHVTDGEALRILREAYLVVYEQCDSEWH